METEHVTIYIIYNFHAMIKSEKNKQKKTKKKTTYCPILSRVSMQIYDLL